MVLSIVWSLASYFRAARTAMLAGRDFAWTDDKAAPEVAVVNRYFASRMFGSLANANGQYYKSQDGAQVQVIGIVENGRYQNLTEDRQPAIFVPFLQSTASAACLLVRSSRDSRELVAAMRTKLQEIDAGLPVDTQSWNNLLTVVQSPARVATMSLGALGIMGAMPSITGIFGMTAYSVSKRLKELGIRMALGAQRREVLQAALERAVKLLAFGSAVGLI